MSEQIRGADIKELVKHSDERGFFREIIRRVTASSSASASGATP